jgi:hypothetical protein
MTGSTTSGASILDPADRRKRLRNMELRAHVLDERSYIRPDNSRVTNVSVAPEAVIAARSAFDQQPQFTA